MSGIITDGRKVISLGVIVPNARNRIPVAFAQPFLEVGVRGSVRVVVDASAQPRPSLDKRDLQAGLGQHIRSDPAARTTTDNADVVDHLIPPSICRPQRSKYQILVSTAFVAAKRQLPGPSNCSQLDWTYWPHCRHIAGGPLPVSKR